MISPDSVSVISEARVDIDFPLLDYLVQRWGSKLDVPVTTTVATGARALRREMETAWSKGHPVVLNPGQVTLDGLLEGDEEHPTTVRVDMGGVGELQRDPESAGLDWTITGRGVDGYRWAILKAISDTAWPVERYRYGSASWDNECDLRLPRTAGESTPVCVVIHGGAWRRQWRRDIMDSLCIDLARRGVATWNIGYRRSGPGTHWPEVSTDVLDAVKSLGPVAQSKGLSTDGVTLLGHSAGGQLALWLAAERRRLLGHSEVGAVVSLAGVTDLVTAAHRGTHDGAAIELMGVTPDEDPGRYEEASPMRRLPIGVATWCTQGMDDLPDLLDMNRRFVAAGRSTGDEPVLIEVEGDNHFDVIDPGSESWRRVCHQMGW